MSDNFAFLLPVMMAILGAAFLVVWRSGPRAALFWGLAYLIGAAAFSCLAVLQRWPDAVQAIASDALFAASFFCFGQALLVRFGRPRAIAVNLAIAGLAIVASGVAVLGYNSLRLELMGSDAACSILIASALLSVRRQVRDPIDWAIVSISALNVVDNLVRGGAAPFTTATDGLESYMGSRYAFFEQASAAVLGLVFGLTALAAVTLDVVAGYRREALTDPLTGLWNRRGFDTAAPDLAKVVAPQGSVLTCDIDHFKRVNDTLGHAVGDQVIVTVAELIRSGLPPGAVVSRFGGEEFIVYLPTPDGEAQLLADQLRRTIAGHAWTEAGVDWPLTASFGLTAIDPDDVSLHDAIARADRSLYEAKLSGRNKVARRRAAA